MGWGNGVNLSAGVEGGGVFLTGAAILVDDVWHHGRGLLLGDGCIAAILPADAREDAMRLPEGSLLTPGLIDIQVNGGGGVLFNDAPTQGSARSMAAAHRRLGTTSILPTLITDAPEQMRQAAEVMVEPGLAGLHFEGPFISPAKPGVHAAEHIRGMEESDFQLMAHVAARGPVLLTLAPEEVAMADIARLAMAGVVVSAGHSVAGAEVAARAMRAGLTGFTHLFNAMPPLSARDPGLAAAALIHPESWCGVIADGIHVHPTMLRLLFATKPERTVLVSDAMPPTGTDAGSFMLQGRMVHRRDGALRTADGTLAGADICLADAVRYCVRALGIDAASALQMATAAPAAFMGLSHLGQIKAGAQADLTLFSADLDVLGTWLAGEWEAA